MTFRHHLTANDGHLLLASLMLIILLSLLSMTAVYLAGQDAPGVSAMREQSQSQQLADAAGDLVVSWFHDVSLTPPSIAAQLTKRQDDAMGAPSFFDAAGRSQFLGTAEQPDILLDAANASDERLLNGGTSGFKGPLSEAGHLDRLKIYAPTQPGLLGTLEVTASTKGRHPQASTIRFQLGAVNMPPARAAVQAGAGLGAAASGEALAVLAHWGDILAAGDMVANRIQDFVVKSLTASVTGQVYEPIGSLEDRWVDYWIGGTVSVLSPPATGALNVPANVHVHQEPMPGVKLDRWDYDLLKKTAQRFGAYYRLDRDGRLHALGTLDSDPGELPADVLSSPTVGRSHGLVFIDTVDGSAPRADNLGTLALDADYVEAVVVVQGHVQVKPGGSGRSMSVLSPPPEGLSALGGRIPVTLSGIHFNGLLFAAGTITIERQTGVYGAVMTSGALIGGGRGASLEVWYNSDFGKGLFRGLPVVYRAPATWQLKY
jgi:hypothetical protein